MRSQSGAQIRQASSQVIGGLLGVALRPQHSCQPFAGDFTGVTQDQQRQQMLSLTGAQGWQGLAAHLDIERPEEANEQRASDMVGRYHGASIVIKASQREFLPLTTLFLAV